MRLWIHLICTSSSIALVRLTPHSTWVHDLHPGLYYPLLFHYLIIFLQQCVHLIGIWLEYQFLFQDMCFHIQVWGYDVPHICSFRYSCPLTLFFGSVYTLGTIYDSILGVWKNKTLSIFMVVMSFLSIWLSFDFGLNFIDRLKVMSTWSFDIGILSLVSYFWQHEMLLISI